MAYAPKTFAAMSSGIISMLKSPHVKPAEVASAGDMAVLRYALSSQSGP